MVLELLLQDASKKPLYLFFIGAVFATVAMIVSVLLFPTSPSIPAVIFMSIPCIYIFTNRLKQISHEQLKAKSILEVFDVNSDIMEMYLYVFLGMVFAVTIWFSVIPKEIGNAIFYEQLYNLRMMSGNPALGNFMSSDIFINIAINNIRLVLIFVLLSFLFGAGAVFILSWNATVVGVAMGLLIRKIQQEGASLPLALAKGLPLSMSYYILHLIPEVVAYFFAAIAGALISSAMTRYDGSSEKAKRLFIISGTLIFVAIFIIILAALIEISISHMIQLRLSV